jgi:hypothetical protein
MRLFLDDLISYISDNFKNDSDISTKVKVNEAYEENSKITPPMIVVQAMDDSDAERFDTFDGELISYVPIQLTIYCQQMQIGDEVVSAKIASSIFADKIKAMFDNVKTVAWNSNIKLMRRVGGTPCMPLQKGTTTYFSPIRFDFYVNKDYQKIN